MLMKKMRAFELLTQDDTEIKKQCHLMKRESLFVCIEYIKIYVIND